MIKKADIFLAVMLVAAGLAMSYFFSFGRSSGDTLLITVNGETFGSYSLFEDREVVIERNRHTNKITIKNGTVSMDFSDCPGQDCVRQRAISQTGESIICLPHQILLEITGGTGEYDTIAR